MSFVQSSRSGRLVNCNGYDENDVDIRPISQAALNSAFNAYNLAFQEYFGTVSYVPNPDVADYEPGIEDKSTKYQSIYCPNSANDLKSPRVALSSTKCSKVYF